MLVSKNRHRIVRGAFLLALTAILLFPLASPARAAEVIPGDPDAHVAEDVVIDDDLFISGRRVTIDGTVNGDVFAAGEEVEINGVIDGTLFVAGQSLLVNGQINDNIVSAAFSLRLGPDADIAGNVYFAGFSLETMEESQIARSVYAAGYQAVMDGQVGRNMLAALSAFQLDGQVAGDVYLELNESRTSADGQVDDFTFYIPENVRVLPEGLADGVEANVGGDFDYRVNRYDVDISPPPTNGDEVASFFFANWVRSRIGEFMALIILGLLLFWLFPGPGRQAVEEMRERPFSSIAWGTGLSLAFPLVLVIAIGVVITLTILLGLVTLGSLAGTVLSFGGLGIAAFWTIFALIFWMLSKVIFTYLIGHSLLERVSPETMDGRWGLFIALVIGVLLYEIIRAIPLLGGLTALVVILLGVGAISQVIWNMWQSRSAASA